MGWKNWPGWVKGGVIIDIIYIILFLIFIRGEPLNLIILEFPAFPILMLLPFIGVELSGGSGLAFLFLILLIYYFILGAIIGYIIGRIKQKRKRS